ncbi:hypothetical protein CENSYa_0881 [Cenarchaeum symbiosum A]|uniref:Uncharacterized protein n=1 Tax=Cenarchaeum symbiosum (strain A) TaxID=414004 RepID=A0RVZ6_CENSY|nr:hypothetical protein CENSYa_0881 [Cenarchaeum symbiosum A]
MNPHDSPPSSRHLPPDVWIPAALHYGRLMESGGLRYAVFGSAAMAAHGALVRPTIDIDFVAEDYGGSVGLMKEQPGLCSSNLERDADNIQVADFHFTGGINVQIWDNNLYSLYMTDESWGRTVAGMLSDGEAISSVSIEDLIVSKAGRYVPYRFYDPKEVQKSVADVVAAMETAENPDLEYVVRRMMEGARRALPQGKIYPIDWFFVREAESCIQLARAQGYTRAKKFVFDVLSGLCTASSEYFLLYSLREEGSVSRFQKKFDMDDGFLQNVLGRWKDVVAIDGDVASASHASIRRYTQGLPGSKSSEYARGLAGTRGG